MSYWFYQIIAPVLIMLIFYTYFQYFSKNFYLLDLFAGWSIPIGGLWLFIAMISFINSS